MKSRPRVFTFERIRAAETVGFSKSKAAANVDAATLQPKDLYDLAIQGGDHRRPLTGNLGPPTHPSVAMAWKNQSTSMTACRKWSHPQTHHGVILLSGNSARNFDGAREFNGAERRNCAAPWAYQNHDRRANPW